MSYVSNVHFWEWRVNPLWFLHTFPQEPQIKVEEEEALVLSLGTVCNLEWRVRPLLLLHSLLHVGHTNKDDVEDACPVWREFPRDWESSWVSTSEGVAGMFIDRCFCRMCWASPRCDWNWRSQSATVQEKMVWAFSATDIWVGWLMKSASHLDRPSFDNVFQLSTSCAN